MTQQKTEPQNIPLVDDTLFIMPPYRTVYGDNTCILYPEHWGPYYNGCNDACDMIQGPCACGATHSLTEWNVKKLLVPEL